MRAHAVIIDKMAISGSLWKSYPQWACESRPESKRSVGE